ncbi:hypothetical protein ABZP36_004083 [Zizania latifolia]
MGDHMQLASSSSKPTPISARRALVPMALLLLLLLFAAPAAAVDSPRRSLDALDKGEVASLAAGNPIVAGAMNDRLKSLTAAFAQQIGRELRYCIKDSDDEWNTAFNFSSDPIFLSNCMRSTDGDLPQRVCTAAEMKFYFGSFLDSNGRRNYVRPNKNCNLTSWIDGCEAGWACSAGKDQKIDLQDAVNFPSRTLDCQGCCAGFFCPHGLTCMILSIAGRDRLPKPGALSLVLLIIYNFSGQLLTNREKRQAKSREAAARHARETVVARERWKSAKDVAKKHAVGLQSSLSRTFSRKKSTLRTHEPSKGGTGLPPNETEVEPSKDSDGNKKSNLTDMMRSLEENPEKGEGFNVEVGEKKKTKGRHAHTQSQIFKYAYGQIEKEKAMEQQNKNLTFSGVISMATEEDIKTRPRIEIAFKDLTLTLKGSKKKLLRSVTGKLMPGRVAAVMGPSGAGKTTFLSAIAGKATGCETTGMILINGKMEPIRAYKKIIGFVPQDDIVHGNLTVQENLWFNARCSYTLYKMFDDLILLAKGGMTVYHGPVKKVEEYFAGLGIVVPERVNPPDYYIDILEGIVKPNTNVAVNAKDLPLRWMLHNGYEVPRDMLQSASDAESSFRGGGDHPHGGDSGQSIAGEVWGNVRDIVGQKKDEYDYNKSSENLSNRCTPGILRQYKYYLGRCGKQRLREARIQGVDYLILGLAGICLGTLAKVSDETFGALGYTYTVIAVSLLCKIGALRSFSLEKIHYWRERASGMSSLAYFLSKDTIDHFNTIIKPIVYLSMFYFFNNPRSSIWENYVILVALVYCVTGIGYTFAIFFQPGSAQLWSALLPVVLTLIATQQKDTFFANLCYTKWALEGFVIANAQRYSGVWLITRCGSLIKNGYDINDRILCIVVLAVNGVLFRCVAFFCMVIFQKH